MNTNGNWIWHAQVSNSSSGRSKRASKTWRRLLAFATTVLLRQLWRTLFLTNRTWTTSSSTTSSPRMLQQPVHQVFRCWMRLKHEAWTKTAPRPSRSQCDFRRTSRSCSRSCHRSVPQAAPNQDDSARSRQGSHLRRREVGMSHEDELLLHNLLLDRRFGCYSGPRPCGPSSPWACGQPSWTDQRTAPSSGQAPPAPDCWAQASLGGLRRQ